MRHPDGTCGGRFKIDSAGVIPHGALGILQFEGSKVSLEWCWNKIDKHINSAVINGCWNVSRWLRGAPAKHPTTDFDVSLDLRSNSIKRTASERKLAKSVTTCCQRSRNCSLKCGAEVEGQMLRENGRMGVGAQRWRCIRHRGRVGR